MAASISTSWRAPCSIASSSSSSTSACSTPTLTPGTFYCYPTAFLGCSISDPSGGLTRCNSTLLPKPSSPSVGANRACCATLSSSSAPPRTSSTMTPSIANSHGSSRNVSGPGYAPDPTYSAICSGSSSVSVSSSTPNSPGCSAHSPPWKAPSWSSPLTSTFSRKRSAQRPKEDWDCRLPPQPAEHLATTCWSCSLHFAGCLDTSTGSDNSPNEAN